MRKNKYTQVHIHKHMTYLVEKGACLLLLLIILRLRLVDARTVVRGVAAERCLGFRV